MYKTNMYIANKRKKNSYEESRAALVTDMTVSFLYVELIMYNLLVDLILYNF